MFADSIVYCVFFNTTPSYVTTMTIANSDHHYDIATKANKNEQVKKEEEKNSIQTTEKPLHILR